MSYIQVDSRGCGAGKTRYTIVPRIRNNMWIGIKTLLVVPSKNLQTEYAKYFSSDEITIINSDTGKIIEQYETAETPVVCLTHEGFLQTPTERFARTNWELIIDEALNTYSTETFNTHDSASRVWVNFNSVFDWKDPSLVPNQKPKTSPQLFFELTVTKSTPPSIINTKLWRKIANPNWRLWCTWETGNNLFTNAAETATIGLELNETVLDNWSSVWIASAAFEKTFMGAWMKQNDIPYTVVYPFEKHLLPVNFHMPTEQFRWSKACRTANPEIEGIFRDYCNQHRTGRLIYNKNNDSDTAFPFSDKLPHNAHGINQFADKTDYAFMSAIQPTALFQNFLAIRGGLSGKSLTFAFQGYMVYQLMMRSALRDPTNTTPVNVFALDTQMILEVMELFDPHLYMYYPNIPVEDKRVKRISKAKTGAERAKLHRQRQKAKTNP